MGGGALGSTSKARRRAGTHMHEIRSHTRLNLHAIHTITRCTVARTFPLWETEATTSPQAFRCTTRLCQAWPRGVCCRAQGTQTRRVSRVNSRTCVRSVRKASIMAAPAPMMLPIAPLPPPAVPHLFTRCSPVGAEPEWDYLRVSAACAVYRAFPHLEWVDVSALFPGHVAAPALSLLRVLGVPMHLDWGTPASDATLKMPELLASLDLAAYARFADAQESLGVAVKHGGGFLRWRASAPGASGRPRLVRRA